MSNMSLDDLMSHQPEGPNPEGDHDRRRKRTIISAVVALAIVIALVVGVSKVWSSLTGSMTPQAATQSVDYPGPGGAAVNFVINPGDGTGVIAENLLKAKVIGSTSAYANAVATTAGSDSLQPGTYALKEQMSAKQALDAMLDPATRVDKALTVIEGETSEQVFTKISEVSGDSIDAVKAVASDPVALGVPEGQASPGVEGRPGTQIEGYLFPATYRFLPGTSTADMLKQMVEQTKSQLTTLKVPQEEWLKTLTEASIVRKEGKLPEDLPKVARVLDNRVEQGMPLQLDSTVTYATGDYSSVFTSDAARQSASPFNTYLNTGMPPGPITNPDLISIQAVQSPADGNWLYFVPINLQTGETVFTSSFDEHNKAIAQLQAWIAANPGNY
ncbi:endolytic transglycosylase MltG [Micrococcales bacterium 31B]|nr:endolytic transglycosylase MltG [Micrococcales bacterium 31B]